MKALENSFWCVHNGCKLEGQLQDLRFAASCLGFWKEGQSDRATIVT